MKIEDILNGYCGLARHWETCKKYYEEAGCDNCMYFTITQKQKPPIKTDGFVPVSSHGSTKF